MKNKWKKIGILLSLIAISVLTAFHTANTVNTFSANAADTTCGHPLEDYVEGFCSTCGAFQEAPQNAEDNYYEISNAGQLYWFAYDYNTRSTMFGITAVNVRLLADIDLGGKRWYPIGVKNDVVDEQGTTKNKFFMGCFDGNNHTVSNFVATGNYAQGFIGFSAGAEIKNLNVVNATVTGYYAGAIVGDSNPSNTLGVVNGKITNCSVRNSTITAYSEKAGSKIYAGAVTGTKNGIVENSFTSNCKVIVGTGMENKAVVAPIGGMGTYNKNCYYTNVTVENGTFRTGDPDVEMTAEQLASGELAYKLGEGWGQEVGKDAYPKQGGKKLYYGYVSCADDATMVYSNNENASKTKPAHSSPYEYAPAQSHMQHAKFWPCCNTAIPESHSFVNSDTCVCGVKKFSIYGQQINLGVDLSMKYYVNVCDETMNTENLVMEFVFLEETTRVEGVYNAETQRYVFTLNNITPQCIGDEIDAYLLFNNEVQASKLDYTVEDNLLALKELYANDQTLVTLINDTLVYGKKASEYKNHGTIGDYVGSDREIPDTQVTPSGAFKGYTVVFGQTNYIKVKTELAQGDALYLDGTDVTAQMENGVFKTQAIAPNNFDKKFTFEIKNGETLVQTFALSVNDYISAQKDSETIGELVKALYNYGASAEDYDHQNGNHDFLYDTTCACGEKIEITDIRVLGDTVT